MQMCKKPDLYQAAGIMPSKLLLCACSWLIQRHFSKAMRIINEESTLQIDSSAGNRLGRYIAASVSTGTS